MEVLYDDYQPASQKPTKVKLGFKERKKLEEEKR
jgi:hypothetical protein